MANRDKAEVEHNATLITKWLVDNRTEFEQRGVAEESLAEAAKISAEQATTAIDRLENHEVVVRDPVVSTKPLRFLIKPGRDWTSTRDKLVGSGATGPA
jgi:hypothetical protein